MYCTYMIQIELRYRDKKFEFLNKRRAIISSTELQRHFGGKIFVNPDNSYLVQREEYRLRERMKQIKTGGPNISAFIKSGKLYQDGVPIDEVNVRNQLF